MSPILNKQGLAPFLVRKGGKDQRSNMEEKRQEKLIELRKYLIKVKNDNAINGIVALNSNSIEELKKEIKRIMQINIDTLDLTIAIIKYALDSKE